MGGSDGGTHVNGGVEDPRSVNEGLSGERRRGRFSTGPGVPGKNGAIHFLYDSPGTLEHGTTGVVFAQEVQWSNPFTSPHWPAGTR